MGVMGVPAKRCSEAHGEGAPPSDEQAFAVVNQSQPKKNTISGILQLPCRWLFLRAHFSSCIG